jgi:hypothetical protein
MSGGNACRCDESRKPIESRAWFVLDRLCNHSAFNGGHRTPSEYSALVCGGCRRTWRTKAGYVAQLPDHDRADGEVPKVRP